MPAPNATAWVLTSALLGLGLGCAAEAPSATKVETKVEAKSDAQPDEGAKTLDPSPAPRPMAGLEGAHVVVAAGARFYPSADASEPIPTRSYRGEHEPGQINARHLGWVMALGEVTDARAQVSFIEGDQPGLHCGRGIEGLDAYALTAWVERSDLLTVTAAPTELRFADGSSATLFAGTPVLPANDEQPRRINAWGFELPLPRDGLTIVGSETLALGVEFIPSTQPAFAGEVGPLPELELRLAGASLEPAALRQDEGFVRLEREVEGQARVRIRGRCIEVEALVSDAPAGLGLGSLGTIGTIGGGYSTSDRHLFLAIPAGTPVAWGDGTPAGTVRSDQRVFAYKAPGEGRCIYLDAGDRHQQVALCFPSDAVRELRLGWIQASDLELAADLKFEQSDLNFRALRLRQPCLSHALEATPTLDVRVAVEARFAAEGSEGPAKVSVKAVEGKLDKRLRACLIEEIGAWKHYALRGQAIGFELDLSSTRL